MTVKIGDAVRLNIDLSHHIIGTLGRLSLTELYVHGTIQYTSGACNSYAHRTVPFDSSQVHHVMGHVITLNGAYLTIGWAESIKDKHSKGRV